MSSFALVATIGVLRSYQPGEKVAGLSMTMDGHNKTAAKAEVLERERS